MVLKTVMVKSGITAGESHPVFHRLLLIYDCRKIDFRLQKKINLYPHFFLLYDLIPEPYMNVFFVFSYDPWLKKKSIFRLLV